MNSGNSRVGFTRSSSSIIFATLIVPFLFVGHLMAAGSSSEADPVLTPEMQQLRVQLTAEGFEERVAAQKKLAETINETPELALFMMEGADAETSVRLVRILESVFLRHNDEIGDRAERSLEIISKSIHPQSVDARGILSGNARLRESRARVAIEKLGGEMVYLPSTSMLLSPRAQVMAAGTGIGFGETATLQSIWLHENWKGTADDLWHLERLAHCPDLSINVSREASISVDDVIALGGVISGIFVTERGPCLGVKSSTISDARCYVGEVLPGGAAAQAGLKTDDIILQVSEDANRNQVLDEGEDLNHNGELDSYPVRSFMELVYLLKDLKIDDQVSLKILREGKEIDITVTLVSWRGIPSKDSEAVSAPHFFAGPLGPEDPTPTPVPTNAETSSKESS